MIFDISVFNVILFVEEVDDVMELVKVKLQYFDFVCVKKVVIRGCLGSGFCIFVFMLMLNYIVCLCILFVVFW